MQAVALRISGDKAMFYRVRVLGTQDTLLDETGNHYFYQCHIQGSVDFIFGRSKSLYEVTNLPVIRPTVCPSKLCQLTRRFVFRNVFFNQQRQEQVQ